MVIRKLEYLKEVFTNQGLDRKQLENIQTKKLRNIIKYSYEHVPYYRKKWKELKIEPNDIKSRIDLEKLPILTREEVKKHSKELVSTEFNTNTCVSRSTSGTSGETLDVFFNMDSVYFQECLLARSGHAIGYRPWHKMVTTEKPRKISLYEKFRKQYLPITTGIERQAMILKKLQPDVIVSYPSNLMLLGRFIDKTPEMKLNPKLLISTGELLLDEHRRIIEQSFNSNVFDQYGIYEFGLLSWECSSRVGHHIDVDNAVLEFVKHDENLEEGKLGKIIVTGLMNKAMPLIRYDSGDMGSYTEELCDCGKTLPLMDVIEGRSDNFIVLPSGRKIGPRSICGPFDSKVLFTLEVANFKVIQKSKHRILIKVEKGDKFTDTTIEKIDKFMNDILKEPVKLDIEVVDKISETRSNKLNRVISEIKN